MKRKAIAAALVAAGITAYALCSNKGEDLGTKADVETAMPRHPRAGHPAQRDPQVRFRSYAEETPEFATREKLRRSVSLVSPGAASGSVKDDPVATAVEVIAEIETLDPEDPNGPLALLNVAMSSELDPDTLRDYFQGLGSKGYPALGVLAERIQKKDPEKAQQIVDQLLDSAGSGTDDSDTMLVAEALQHAQNERIPERLYDIIQREPNEETRFRLYGALSRKTVDPNMKARFKSLALSDPSEDIQAIGRDWESLIEAMPEADVWRGDRD